MTAKELIGRLKMVPDDAIVSVTISEHCGCPSAPVALFLQGQDGSVFLDASMPERAERASGNVVRII